MSNKNIRIILDDDDGNSQAVQLSDIPTNVWEAFAKRAGNGLDVDDKSRAWASIFSAVIQSEFLTNEVVIPYIKSQKQGEYTFLLAGIPLEARDKFEMAASQANMTPALMVALLFDAAMNNQLHALSLKPIEEHTGFHVMITTGITNETWAAWENAANKLRDASGEDVRGDNFLGFLLEKALWGEMMVTTNDPQVKNPEAYDVKNIVNESNMGKATVEREITDLKNKMDVLLKKVGDNDNKDD